MKKNNILTAFIILFAVTLFTSCQNTDWDFPDYEYQSVYFSYQYPVRTIILGEYIYNNDSDNNHQFKVMATTGGVYENFNDVRVHYEIDASMLEGFEFGSSGQPIQALPNSYYEIMSSSDEMIIPKGEMAGGMSIQLTEDFFQDPDAINTTYVLPVQLLSVANADTILQGVPNELVSNPRRGNAADWDVLPRDFTFYAIKYINHYDGLYLRRGADIFTDVNGETETTNRNSGSIVKDEVVELNTESLTRVSFPFTIQDNTGNDVHITILLDVDEQGDIIVSDEAADYTVSGTGTFINQSESQEHWGEKSRNAIYLDYVIDWNESQRRIETVDTLVLRDRGIGVETFTPELP